MKHQEAEVMENFPARFYNSPHVQPPVVTKLRLNEEKLASGGEETRHPGPFLSEEDRKLEERLRKLKESHKPTTLPESEAALKERLARLRDEQETQSPAGDQSNSGSTRETDVKQADNLVDQMADRVRLDAKTDPNGSHQLEDSISTMLSGMEIQLEDEDPNKLLEDLQAFQSRQEQSALAEATSKDVQDLVTKAKELQKEESEPTSEGCVTPYPQLPPEITVGSHGPPEEGKVSGSEISQVLEAAKREMEEERKKQAEMDKFMSDASKKLAELRGVGGSGDVNQNASESGDDSEVVRSKLGPRKEGEKAHSPFDFSWNHFGEGGGASNFESSTDSQLGDSAARQLGITLSSEVILDGATGTDSGDEVAGLLQQTMAEAALDRRLEERGLDHYLKPKQLEPRGGGAVGGVLNSSGGASAAVTNYLPSSGGAASGWGLDPNDLPWCCICNADAHIRCYDCDNDLYCTQCFSEGHEQFGLFDHKYAPFEPLVSRAV